MKVAIIVLALTLTAFSCRQDEHMTARQKSVVINEAQQTLQNYYRDIAETGLTAEFKYLDHSPDFFWVPPGYTVALSYDSVATLINEHAPLFKSVKNTFDTLKIVPISPELAMYTGRLKSIMTDTSGNVSELTLMETGLLIKRSDGWKLLNGQTSTLTQY